MRNAGIDIAHAREKGIVVSGTGSGGNSTLEHIWALILSVARNIVNDDANVKLGNPQWQTTIPTGLHGKTLGLIGVGGLGTQTAHVRLAHLFPSLFLSIRQDCKGIQHESYRMVAQSDT